MRGWCTAAVEVCVFLYFIKTFINFTPCVPQQPVKYYGDRSKESLKSFAMQYVTSTVTELWAGNVHLFCLGGCS